MTELADKATPLTMAEQIHRPIPDGTRRLEWRDGVTTLALGQSRQDHPCYVSLVHERSATVDALPASCQVTIPAGRFFLRYRPEFAPDRQQRYCAPCAVREWGPLFEVREAS